MQLSLHADYALRVLIYLGAHPGAKVSTLEISRAYGISRNHLVRVVQTLAQHGYLEVIQGRGGGVMLGRDPQQIRLGDVVKVAEANLRLVECFDRETNTCPITQVCGLKGLLREALQTFLADLNRHTLGDLMTAQRRRDLAGVFVQITGTGLPSTRRRSPKDR